MSGAFHLVILGSDTPVGRALVELVQAKEVSFHAILQSDWKLDDPDVVAKKVSELKPQFLVNCIPPSHNGTTAHIASVLSQVCAAQDVALVQLSSNKIFAGQDGESFKEEDQPEPQTEYGQTVLAVETAIASSCKRHLILRTGWLFSSMGHDYANQLLELAQSHEHLKLSDAKPLCPTSACDIAFVILGMLNQARYAELWGSYHYSSAEQTSLFKFAEVIVAEARQYEELTVQNISSDPSDDMNTLFSESSPKLNTKKMLYTFGIEPKPWRQALARILKKRYAQS